VINNFNQIDERRKKRRVAQALNMIDNDKRNRYG
jgi:hypothetical protein